MNKTEKIKNIVQIVCAIVVLILLAGLAYIGLANLLKLPVPEILFGLGTFYDIFSFFEWSVLFPLLALIIGSVFAITVFAKKGKRVILLILEVIFILIFLLHGFGAF